MFFNKSKESLRQIFALADVKLDGNRPWDIHVYQNEFYGRVLRYGSLGLGESYMDGWWEAEKLDEFFAKILRAELEKKVRDQWKLFWQFFINTFFNRQKKSKSFKIGEHHYDLGNNLFQAMLDKRMVYTCGYFKNTKNLDEAQEIKLDMACKKLGLQKGMKILDIGCGWGSFAKYAAEKYGVSVLGITVSKEQVELGRKLCAGLPIEIKLQDYREIKGLYDHIVSFGMFEHVGEKNYRSYMEIINHHLRDNGLFLLHTIGNDGAIKTTDPWVEKYIFPRGRIPSIKQISKVAEKLFVMEDWHNFGADYDKTLMAWFNNFASHWKDLKSRYDERFYRMWKYFLLSSAGSFRVRRNQLWQIVFSKKGVPGGYTSIR